MLLIYKRSLFSSLPKLVNMLNTLQAVLTAQNKSTAIPLGNGQFKFTLASAANTSAGVYDQDDRLVRTLWSSKKYAAGTYTEQWNGLLDDYVTQASIGHYTVKVLSNNVQYDWEGVIGNTSGSLYHNKFGSFAPGFGSLAFSATRAFWGDAFAEGGRTLFSFELADTGTNNVIPVDISALMKDCVFDSETNTVYWSCFDDYTHCSYIVATDATTEQPVSFPNEQTFVSGRSNWTYSHFFALNVSSQSNSLREFQALAVQKIGNYLFTASSPTNELLTYNKHTAELVRTSSFKDVKRLVCGNNNDLWMIVKPKNESAFVVKKYSIASDGTLTDSGIRLNTIDPESFDISYDGSIIAVCDLATFQVKAYSTTDGSPAWTLGQSGGYVTNGPQITNDKFLFQGTCLVKFKQDNSFVVQCNGTYRLLFYNADRSYTKFMAFVPSSRSSNADPNNPNSLFSDELEFVRDYSKALDNGVNDSWKYAYTWKIGTDLDVYGKFKNVITLENGITYGLGSNGNFYELNKTTGARYLGYVYGHLEADGSLWHRDWQDNNHAIIYKRELLSFDSNKMPQWGDQVQMVSTPVHTNTSPDWYYDNTKGESTNPRRYIFFNPNGFGGTGVDGTGYHLGSVRMGESTYEWLTSNSTRPNGQYTGQYHGQYPLDGWFDIGNNEYTPQHSENCGTIVHGKDIFWNTNNEFYKANAEGKQANVWNHFHESGLHIGHFGVTGYVAWVLQNSYGMAGNGYSAALVKVGNDYYIYHCDEGIHSGLHSWHVSGLDTISLQTISLDVPIPIVPIIDTTDLMVGLPWRADGLYTNISPHWSAYPTSGASEEADFVNWYVGTSVLGYLPDNIDLYSYVNGGNAYDHYLICDFLTTTQSNNWRWETEIVFNPAQGTNYIEILDDNDKIIIQLQFSFYNVSVNGLSILDSTGTPTGSLVGDWNFWNKLYVECVDGTLQVKYSRSDVVLFTKPKEGDADLTKPRKYRSTTWGANDGGRSPMAVRSMRFIPGLNNPNAIVIPIDHYSLVGSLDLTLSGANRLKSNGIIEPGIESYPNDNTSISLWHQTDNGVLIDDTAHIVTYLGVNNDSGSSYKLTITGDFLSNGLYFGGAGGITATNYTPASVQYIIPGNANPIYWEGKVLISTMRLEKLI